MDPITGLVIGGGSLAVGGAALVVSAAQLGYNVHKDRKKKKRTTNDAKYYVPPPATLQPIVQHQVLPISCDGGGREAVFIGPKGGLVAIGHGPEAHFSCTFTTTPSTGYSYGQGFNYGGPTGLNGHQNPIQLYPAGTIPLDRNNHAYTAGFVRELPQPSQVPQRIPGQILTYQDPQPPPYSYNDMPTNFQKRFY